MNEGLITPVVLFAIAAVAGEEGLRTGMTVLAEARVGRFTTASIADRSRSAARRFPLAGT